MLAAAINQIGGAEALRLIELPTPEVGVDDVLIQVHYSGVNPADWKCREGALAGFFTYQFPFVLGFDLAGVVAAVGANVQTVAVGDQVFAQSDVGIGRWGSFAEFSCVSQSAVVKVPSGITLAQAAATPTPALAAWAGLIDDGGLKAGQTVLIHGGASAVGVFAIQLAKHLGATVAATSRGLNHDYLKSLGCDYCIDYQEQDIGQALSHWCSEGVDLVLDCIGCNSLPNAYELLKPGGILVAILTLVAGDSGPDQAQAQQRGLRTALTYSKLPSGPTLASVAQLLAAGTLQPPRLEVLTYQDAPKALARLQEGSATRKQVLAWPVVAQP